MANEKFIALEETSQEIKTTVNDVKTNVDGLKNTDVPGIDSLIKDIYQKIIRLENKIGSSISVYKTYEFLKTKRTTLFSGLDKGCENDGVIYTVNNSFTQLKKYNVLTKEETSIVTTNQYSLSICRQIIYYDGTLFALASSDVLYLDGNEWILIGGMNSGALFLYNNELFGLKYSSSSTSSDRKLYKVTRTEIKNVSGGYSSSRMNSISNTFTINGNTYYTGSTSSGSSSIPCIFYVEKGTRGDINVEDKPIPYRDIYGFLSVDNQLYLCANSGEGYVWMVCDNELNKLAEIKSKITLNTLCIKSFMIDNCLCTVTSSGTVISEPSMYLNIFLVAGTKLYTDYKFFTSLPVDTDGGYMVETTGNIEVPILYDEYNITVIN